MKRTAIFLTILMMFLTGCGVTKRQPTVITIVKDSLVTEIHERVVYDTVEFVPPEFFQSYTSADTLSFIENKYAKTTAIVHDGLLTHTLESVPNVIRIPVAVPVRDTTTYERHDGQQTTTEYVEVEKKLTKWQEFKMRMGGYTMLAFLIFAIIVAVREFIKRKK